MAENKSEQATPRRRQKAREKGQVVRSRDLASAASAFAVILLLGYQGTGMLLEWRQLFWTLLGRASHSDIYDWTSILQGVFTISLKTAVLPLGAAFFVAAGVSLAQGGVVIAPGQLSAKIERINPATRLSQIFSVMSLAGLLKSLLPFSAIAYLAYSAIAGNWALVLRSSFLGIGPLLDLIWRVVWEVSWKSTLVLLVWGVADYMFLRQKHERDLRMTKQEVREELKESEGNPQMKARIRRMQRQVSRRRMLQDVKRATVVITNPTHFAIALEYRPEMVAPVVVAKGANLFAQEIKQAALWHGVPMVENPPLAHSLYRAVEVGQAIPSKLYTAVAEILALIYRAQQQAARARRGQ